MDAAVLGGRLRSRVPGALAAAWAAWGMVALSGCAAGVGSLPDPDDDGPATDADGSAADDDTAPADDDTAPADDDSTPVEDDDTTPADDDTTAPDDDTAPVEDDDATGAPDDDTTGTGDDDTAPVEDDDSTPVGDDDTAPIGDDDSAPVPSCGDGSCGGDESCWDCAADCGACDCPLEAEVVVYTQSAWNVLGDAFLADPCACADYFISLPALSDDKTSPRAGGEPEAMRDRGPRFHAMAEFHWATWEDEPGDWYDKGTEFRSRMELAGYDVDAGDTWAINELPSTIRSDDAVRDDAIELFRGLYDGPPGSPTAKGTAFVIGMGQGTVNFSVYKPNVQDWLEDAHFWEQANLYVRFWAQEVYADPYNCCVSGTVTAERSAATNAYVEHFARHAEVGPDSANTAQSYLGRAYVPLMNAVWNSTDSGYGDTTIPLEQMQHFVSTEVYAARAWSIDHNHPDGRLGFAWARTDGTVDSDLEVLATRLAQAIRYAYDEGGGSASHACSPSGAYTWCQCSLTGAAFNTGWETFETW